MNLYVDRDMMEDVQWIEKTCDLKYGYKKIKK